MRTFCIILTALASTCSMPCCAYVISNRAAGGSARPQTASPSSLMGGSGRRNRFIFLRSYRPKDLNTVEREPRIQEDRHHASVSPETDGLDQTTTTQQRSTRQASLPQAESSSSERSFWEDLPTLSVLLLNFVAVLWGSQHAIIKTVIDDSSDPATFSLLRFGVAALLASPYLPGLSSSLSSEGDAETETKAAAATSWRWGAEMGLWMFLGFSFQAIGLEFTTAQRSGFLLYLNVKFVPFLARFLLGREISPATWASAVVAFAGTALLAIGPADQGLDLNVGDLWSIAAAAASAMFILRLERASAAVPDAAGLNAACLWVVFALAFVWTFLVQSDWSALALATMWTDLVSIATSHPLEIIYLSGVTTTLANWIQSKAQRDISAERASVIYAMDPVYGAIFSNWLLGETLNGIQGWVGAGLITGAAATNAFLDFSNNSVNEQRKSSQPNADDVRENPLSK